MINLEVHSTYAVIRSQEPLTVGLRGAKAFFAFGEPWEGLVKTAVFRQGQKTVAVTDIGQEVTIPWEVLTLPGVPVMIGIYGVDAAGAIAIPTLWAQTEPVRPGADPEADPSIEPTPGLWEQMQEKMGSLEQLQTHVKFSLVDAINEANRPAYLITVSQNEDGSYVSDYDVVAIQAMLDAGIPFLCYWYEKDITACLSGFQKHGPFTFVSVYNAREYQIVISEAGVKCTVRDLAAEAPVTSVNGQTGDVTLPVPVWVTVTEEPDGTYTAENWNVEKILEVHNAGNAVFCQLGKRVMPLMLASKAFCEFGCVYSGNMYTVKIGHSNITVDIYPVVSEETEGGVLQDAIKPPETASVGQTIVVKEVDENGKPILWEAADLPSGGSGSFNDNPLELINEITLEEDVHEVLFNTEADGTPLELEDFYIQVQAKSTTDNTAGHTTVNGVFLQNFGFVVSNTTAFSEYTITYFLNIGQAIIKGKRNGVGQGFSSSSIAAVVVNRPITSIRFHMASFGADIQSGSNFKLYGRRVKK